MSEKIIDPKPSTFSQFCFFKSLSYSLFEGDWSNMVESWQSMVAVNAPLPEFIANLKPFFANAPWLLPVFHRYMSFVQKDQDFLSTLTTVLLSTPLLIKVQRILQSTQLFSEYMVALQLDNPSASHTQVMHTLQTFLSRLPEPQRLEIQRVFAEEEAADSMGLTTSTLDQALQLLHSDTQLYIDILSTLQLNQIENLPWNAVVEKIGSMVLERKPQAWSGIQLFLQGLHSQHHPESFANVDEDEFGGDEVLEKVEGIDYYRDVNAEKEFETYPEGDDYDRDYATFLHDMQDIQSGRNVLSDDFAALKVGDSLRIVESC
ncbi:hypothetical protein BGW38_003993 [Lunasporangiospora selenospora]|uniref:Uncharacterized protein n=1 Tax=Lunasporangiospora selenospora TaxID=979761 RepID=A0A9P6FQN9_9FUNG|nr:hypothetical protein BGW38_003993 [Lunasporangiospora selenospora]